MLSGSQHYLNKQLIEFSFRIPPSFAETLVEIMAEFLRKRSEKKVEPYTEEQIQEFCLSLRKSYEEGKVNLKTIENKIDEEYLKELEPFNKELEIRYPQLKNLASNVLN